MIKVRLFALCSFEAPLASMLTERRQTVRKQYEAQQQKRALQDTTNYLSAHLKATPTLPNTIASILVLPSRAGPTLHLDRSQKLQLQQQLQQVLIVSSLSSTCSPGVFT